MSEYLLSFLINNLTNIPKHATMQASVYRQLPLSGGGLL